MAAVPNHPRKWDVYLIYGTRLRGCWGWKIKTSCIDGYTVSSIFSAEFLLQNMLAHIVSKIHYVYQVWCISLTCHTGITFYWQTPIECSLHIYIHTSCRYTLNVLYLYIFNETEFKNQNLIKKAFSTILFLMSQRGHTFALNITITLLTWYDPFYHYWNKRKTVFWSISIVIW